MDDLYSLVKQAVPLAKLILLLSEKAKELGDIDRTLAARREAVEEAQAELDDILDKGIEAKNVLSVAQAETVEARSQANSILAQARKQSEDLVAAAQAEADSQVKRIKLAARAEIELLDAEIGRRSKKLEELIAQIEATTIKHNSVLSSIQSLQSRLNGAA